MRAVTLNVAAAQATFDNADGASALPARCEALWRYMVLAGLAQETFFGAMASQYDGLAKSAAADLGLVIGA